MDTSEIMLRLLKIAGHRDGCLCSMRESCDKCSQFGTAASMERDIRDLEYEIRNGHPRPPMTIADYGKSVAISLPD